MKKEEYLRKALLLVSNPYTKAQVQRACAGLFCPGGVRGTVYAVWV